MGFGVSKSSKAEMDERVEVALTKMIQERIKYDDYLSFARDEYGYHRTQANEIWKRARDLRNQYMLERVEDEIVNAVEELEQYEMEMLASDNQQADALRLRAKDMKYKIKGLYQERIRLEGNINTTIKFEWGDNDDNIIDVDGEIQE